MEYDYMGDPPGDFVAKGPLSRFVLIFSLNTNLGTHMGHLRFVILFGRNNQHENIEKCMFYCITFLNFLNSDQGVPTNSFIS